MTGKGKSNIDVNTIIKAVKSIIETMQLNNKTNLNENTVPESVFNSIYKKVEDAMKKAGNAEPSATIKDELDADNDFFNDASFEKTDSNQTEIEKIKTSFKIEEEKLKIDFQNKLNELKFTFKEKHDSLKQNFQTKINALKEQKV